MTDRNPMPPPADDLTALLAAARRHVLQHASISRTSRRRRRTRIIGAVSVAAIALGGATTATATGVFGGVDASDSATRTFDLGAAPAGSTYVQVTLDVVCSANSSYGVDLDRAGNPAELRCGDGDAGQASQLAYDMPLSEPGPEHTLTVLTDADLTYELRAHYRSGLTENQRISAELAAKEAKEKAVRDENARTIERTDRVPSDDPYGQTAYWPDPYYVTDSGLTIGSYSQETPYDQRPDLVPALAPNGEKAFTYTDKRSQTVGSSKDALAYMDWLVSTGQMDPAVSGRWSTLYKVYVEQDGKTIVARVPNGSSKSE